MTTSPTYTPGSTVWMRHHEHSYAKSVTLVCKLPDTGDWLVIDNQPSIGDNFTDWAMHDCGIDEANIIGTIRYEYRSVWEFARQLIRDCLKESICITTLAEALSGEVCAEWWSGDERECKPSACELGIEWEIIEEGFVWALRPDGTIDMDAFIRQAENLHDEACDEANRYAEGIAETQKDIDRWLNSQVW